MQCRWKVAKAGINVNGKRELSMYITIAMSPVPPEYICFELRSFSKKVQSMRIAANVFWVNQLKKMYLISIEYKKSGIRVNISFNRLLCLVLLVQKTTWVPALSL